MIAPRRRGARHTRPSPIPLGRRQSPFSIPAKTNPLDWQNAIILIRQKTRLNIQGLFINGCPTLTDYIYGDKSYFLPPSLSALYPPLFLDYNSVQSPGFFRVQSKY